MINQLRHEALSGAIDDLAHVVSQDCMSDCLTKTSAKADALIKTVNTGTLPNCDKHPPFRELMNPHHKAFLAEWIISNFEKAEGICSFAGIDIEEYIHDVFYNRYG